MLRSKSNFFFLSSSSSSSKSSFSSLKRSLLIFLFACRDRLSIFFFVFRFLSSLLTDVVKVKRRYLRVVARALINQYVTTHASPCQMKLFIHIKKEKMSRTSATTIATRTMTTAAAAAAANYNGDDDYDDDNDNDNDKIV